MKDLFGQEEIRALSWKEPFGTLMLYGKIETRSWATPYRGLVLICTSKQPYATKVIKNICGEKQYARIWEFFQRFHIDISFTYGHAIGIGRLVDCRLMKKQDEDKCFVQFNHALWCHVYEEVKAIKPFPWKGSLGWQKVDQEARNKIEFA